jgi:hypothetical protein
MVPPTVRCGSCTKSGETVDGGRLNEDTYTVQLLDARGRLRSLAKSDLRYAHLRTASLDAVVRLAPHAGRDRGPRRRFSPR